MMTNRRAVAVWHDLSRNLDLIGRTIRFDNRVGDVVQQGIIRLITVHEEDDIARVTVECESLRERLLENEEWGSPFEGQIHFRITDEDAPHLVGRAIFYDLDERRQICIN